MTPISIIICCANAQDTLPAACASAKWADELLVVDSGSTDQTPRIAQEHADRYVLEPWRGYDKQKVFAASIARNDWVFFLDGDEEISDALAQEIQALPDTFFEANDLVSIPRLNYIFGKPVRPWLPDELTRLMHRDRVTWPEEALHDRRIPSDPSRVSALRGHLLHKRASKAGFEDYFSGQRMDERLLMVARAEYERGKRARWYDLVLRPQIAFLKFYLLKLGFRDGTFGLLIAQKAYLSTQLKYAALWAVQNGLDRRE